MNTHTHTYIYIYIYISTANSYVHIKNTYQVLEMMLWKTAALTCQ